MQTHLPTPARAKQYNPHLKEISDYGHDAQGLPIQAIGTDCLTMPKHAEHQMQAALVVWAGESNE